MGFTVALLAAGAGCENNGDEDTFERDDGSLQGELVIFMADNFETGVQTKQYGVRSASGQVRDIEFDKDPGLEAGTKIRVWGLPTTTPRMRVTSVKQLAVAEATITSELKMGTKYPAKRLAFVIVDIGGGTNVSKEQATAEIIGPSTNTDPPLRDYYAEVSYGTEALDGMAFGPFRYDVGACSNSDTSNLANSLRPMVDQMGGGTFNHYLWYLGSNTGNCGWSGLGEVGRPDRPANDTWYNASRSCVVMIQEPGHNFGMQHSSSMDCGSVTFPDVPDDNCTHGEYGDKFDPMGGGCKHMNAWQKTYNGWTQGCNMVRVRSSGTFTLTPLELPCDGAQVLQIPMPKMRPFYHSGGGGQPATDQLTHYYLELRTKRGTDNVSPSIPTSVQVRVSGDIKGRSDRGLHTWIIDMEPSTSAFDGMGAGKTFEDPAGGVSFTVMELDENHATVNVTMTANNGGPVCMDGTTAFTAPGPGIESCAPGIATPDGGFGGAGGTTGAGGRGGAGGTTGGRGGAGGTTGGRGGAGGSAVAGNGGRGGAGGTGGTAGTGTGGSAPGGTTGTGNTAGTGPTGVAGGAGTDGTAGTGGNTGGSMGSGGATTPIGSGGSTGGGTVPPGDRGVSGGCACDTAPGSTPSLGATLLLCASFGLAVAVRRRGQRLVPRPGRRLARSPRRRPQRAR